MSALKPLLGITMGDATGCGPEIIVKSLAETAFYDLSRPVVIGDAKIMERAAKIVGGAVKIRKIADVREAGNAVGVIDVLDLDNLPSDLPFAKVDARAGKAAYEYVAKGVELAMRNEIDAIVTAPLNKEAMNLGGYHYAGHTEILGALSGTKDYAMMLVGGPLRVIHVSTHVSLREACNRTKKARVLKVIELADESCKLLGLAEPRVAVAGLNPHAGEGGLFGTEEIEEIIPAIDAAKSRGINVSGPTVGFVFKTISDQFGKYSFVKVLSGKISSDMSLRNMRARSTDKLGRLYIMSGKKNTEIKEVACGDIVAIGKMDWKTGDTVCDPKNEVELPPVELPDPCYSMAIFPKTKGQDDKVAAGLSKLNEEDVSFSLVNNGETKQQVLSGAGDIQLDVLCSKLKSRFGVEAELKPARVPYREKIKAKVEAHGRHKKQTGGSGQFGDVWVRFEPQDEQDEMIFAEEVFGGSVPKNFFPAVEKGLREAVNKGVLAGYPLVGLKATLYDGSYHPVDSNEMAFKTAAQLAYKEGIPNAKPTILEPIGTLKVTIPDASLGDIMSDISSKRRGTVLGMTAEDGMQTVEAEVPMAEMSSYTIDLRSMTQGRGSFTLKFNRYEEAPQNVQQKVIEEAKKEQEA